jgi:phosphoribosylglycinamide formyltransferase-1
MTKIAILASHNGSGFDSLLKAQVLEELDIQIVLVISNNTNAKVLLKAQLNNIDTKVINSKTSLHVDNDIDELLTNYEVDYVFLSGYMKKISPQTTKKFKIINSHPSLLPLHGGAGMYGRFVHEAVINAQDLYSGVSIHFVDPEFDSGEIILQKKLKLDKNETALSLETKIKQLEKVAIPEAFKICLK